VLYVGVTSDIKGRIAKHKSKHYAGSFTAQYNLDKLVYYEKIDGMVKAIEREKQLKGGPRRKKSALIKGYEPGVAGLLRGALANVVVSEGRGNRTDRYCLLLHLCGRHAHP